MIVTVSPINSGLLTYSEGKKSNRSRAKNDCVDIEVFGRPIVKFLSLRRRRRLYVFGSSVRAAVRASVRPSVIHVVVLCFRDISSIC